MTEDPADAGTASWGEVPDVVARAIAKATEKINALADATQEPPPRDAVNAWLSIPPSDWRGTPDLATWVALDLVDPALRFETPEGCLRNLLDAAVEILLDLEVLRTPDWIAAEPLPPWTGT